MADIWTLVHAERSALAADLTSLSEAQWETPSLCTGWTVRDALAHMTATAKIGTGSFFAKLIGSGFNLKKMQAKDIATERAGSGADVLGRFRSVLTLTKSPPGPKKAWLGEAVVHAEDIRRPLGLKREYPTEATTMVADFYAGSNALIGTKRRIEGVKLVSTDAAWTHGSGPEVSGPMIALLMAMTGRKAALADLTGEGVATLAGRP